MELDVGKVRIFYETLGSGPPMLLVHGNGGSHHGFKNAAKVLSPHYTLYMPDTRGHGRSGDVETFHYEDFAEDLYLFCKALGIEKPVYVGHSDGGITGLYLASRHPELLKEAFICGANLTPAGFRAPVRAAIGLKHMFDKNDLTRLMLREPWLRKEDLEKITIPVHVTAGAFDIVKKKETLSIAEMLPHADVKIFPFREHSGYVVLEKTLARYVLETLNKSAEIGS